MSRPTWVIFYAIFMVLVGGCSLINDIGNLDIDKQMDQVDKMLNKINDSEKSDQVADTTTLNHEEVLEDESSTININTTIEGDIHRDSIDSTISSILGDSIIFDENNKVDMMATLKVASKMSDYRKSWVEFFARISIVFSILFIVGAVLLWKKYKFTVRFIISLLSLSLGFGLFQYFVYKADTESGSLAVTSGNFDAIFSIIVDVILLIVFMVLDKSYFTEEKFTEDY